jgi:hypothetical protein
MPDIAPHREQVLLALVGSGFANVTVSHGPNFHMFRATRVEQLDNEVRYAIAVAHERFSQADMDWLVKDVGRDGHSLILVGAENQRPNGAAMLTYHQFFDRLGGPIFSVLPFDPDFADRLSELGHNKVPNGLGGGKADALFEKYVHAALQFLFPARVIPYGTGRRGEPVPDGIAISRSMPILLYDAKAYHGGFPVELDDIRRFADYVNEFSAAYATVVGHIGYFIVISGSFRDDIETLEDRARTFRSKCDASATISFMTADVLGSVVKLLVKDPLFRPVINWGLIFERPLVRLKDVEKQLLARAKDGVLPTMNSPTQTTR